MIMLAKGNRSQQVTDACKNTAASTLAVSVVRPLYWRREVLRAPECVEYPELGMEAI